MGCSECNEGLLQIEKVFQQKQICMKNPNLYSNVSNTSNLLIQNCKTFQNTSQIKCLQCQPNYVLNDQSNYCFSDKKLTDCKVALDQYQCKTCNDEYYLEPNWMNCLRGKIFGCAVYSSQTNCSSCLAGYKFYNNRCHLLPQLNSKDSFTTFDGTNLTLSGCQNAFFSV